MREGRKRALRVQFGGKLRLEFHGAKITSDAGLLPVRQLDEAFRLTESANIMCSGSRRGKNTRHTLPAMLRHADSRRNQRFPLRSRGSMR
ncbi:MAG: transposase [Planctomycetes bacterium]|nr:transposase [Planctomycetota bacterium]